MSQKPGFDTMRGIKQCGEGGLDRPAAEAIVLFAEEATANLATKDQVTRVREDLGKEIRITALKQRLWLGGIVIATSLALAAYLSWMLPLVDARVAPQQQPAVRQAEP